MDHHRHKNFFILKHWSSPDVLAYSLRRLLSAIPTLLILVAFSPSIRAAPGGLFDTERQLARDRGQSALSTISMSRCTSSPLSRRSVAVRFGPSFQYRDYTVTELIMTGFPVSLTLGGTAILVALLGGVTAGCIAALRQNSVADHGVMAVSMTGISIPNFVMAPLLVLVFAVYLPLPAGGLGKPRFATRAAVIARPAANRLSCAATRQHRERAATSSARPAQGLPNCRSS
jgi:oligopeptide transport system permease protein